MKTIFTVLSFLSAASLPGAFAVEFAGMHLPAGLDAIHVFVAFVIALLGLTALADYARPAKISGAKAKTVSPTVSLANRPEKSAHPLAA